MGFSQGEIEDMSQAHSYEAVAEALGRLQAAETRLKSTGRPITSKKSYFNGILSNIAAGVAGDDLDHAKIEAEAAAQEVKRIAEQRQTWLTDEFNAHVANVFATRLFELDEAQREQLCKDFETATPSANLLLSRGWTPKNKGALTLLRLWMAEHRKDVLDTLLPNPEDNGFDAWMMWRLTANTNIDT